MATICDHKASDFWIEVGFGLQKAAGKSKVFLTFVVLVARQPQIYVSWKEEIGKGVNFHYPQKTHGRSNHLQSIDHEHFTMVVDPRPGGKV